MRAEGHIRPLLLMLLMGWLQSAVADPGYVARPGELMDEPYRDAKVLLELEEGQGVEIQDRKGGWYSITVGEQTGWVRMSTIRKGEMVAPPSEGAEVGGVLDLASGRAGSGNVVAATGVRGLNEEELKAAQFNEAEIKKMESYAINRKQAQRFAHNGKLTAREMPFLPAPAEEGDF